MNGQMNPAMMQAYMMQMQGMIQQLMGNSGMGGPPPHMQQMMPPMPWGVDYMQSATAGKTEKTIFIGNLAETVTHLQLEEAFSKFGEIKFIRLFAQKHYGFVTYNTAKEAALAKACADQTVLEGRNMRISFGKFKSGENELPIANNPNAGHYNNFNTYIDYNAYPQQPMYNYPSHHTEIPRLVPDDRPTRMNEENEQQIQSGGPKTIFVGNLAPQVTPQILEAVFNQFGTIVSTKLVANKHYGFVTFSTAEDAADAKQYGNGAMIEGRPMRVDFGKM